MTDRTPSEESRLGNTEKSAVQLSEVQLPVLPKDQSTVQLIETPTAEAARSDGDAAVAEDLPLPVPKTREQIIQTKRQQMAYLEQRREQKRRKVFYRRLKRLAGVMYLFMIAAAVFFVVTSSVWRYDGKNFQLHNAQLLTAKNITPLIAAYQDWPMIRIDPEDISAAIKAQYTITQDVYVRRALFPPRLDITVVEKRPFAELYTNAKATAPYALLTEDQSIIPLALYPYNPQKSPYAKTLPHILLPATSSMNASAIFLLSKATTLLRQTPDLHFKEIRFIFTPSRKPRQAPIVSLVAQFEEVRVLLGNLDWELPKRLARLNALVPKILELKGLISDVDLRWSSQVTFRKKSENTLGDIIGQGEETAVH